MLVVKLILTITIFSTVLAQYFTYNTLNTNIVIFGGNTANGTPVSPYAQLVNPIFPSQTIASSPTTPSPYASCCVPALNYNGKVYVIGGSTNTGTILNNVYSYRMTSNSIGNPIVEPSMIQQRAMHSSVVMRNNLLYACGGLITQTTNTNLCETLAVANCGSGSCTTANVRWVAAPAMPSNRWDHVAVALNSKMYIIGGATGQGQTLAPLETVISFDQSTNTWTNEPSMSSKRKGLGAVVAQNKIYVCGGTSNGQTPLNTCESYDPSTRRWTPSVTLQIPRVDHRMVTFNQLIVVIGGQNSNNTVTDRIEVFYPQMTNTVIAPQVINGAREVFAAASN